MILYYAPHTCALASHIALEHAGADYRLQRIDFSKNEQRSAEFLRVNPKGRVPALVTSRGVLTETPAILMYICRHSRSRRWRRSTATCARRFMLRTRTGCAANAGRMTPGRSRR